WRLYLGCNQLEFHIKRNIFTIYILNLAAANFGFLLCLPGFLITFNARHLFCFPLAGLNLINSFHLLSLLAYSTSLYLLTAISTERRVSVLFPIWHRCRRPKNLSAIVYALLWALSSLLSGIVYSLCFVDGTENCWLMFLAIYGLNFLIFAPIMICVQSDPVHQSQSSSQRHQQEKLYTVILLTVLFFLIFAVPLSVKYILDLVYDSHANDINPVIYFLVGSYRQHRFRGCFQVTLWSIFEEKTDLKEHGETSRQDTVKMSI
uniref:G-protein coupled receptors family 1 profile domain-containing protein n=1 Tax=Gopherus evgoodei TaxID=1825980 RepID=A0A8C4W0X3_9SAUR